MKRLFWLAMGITVGVLVMRKLSAMVQKLTPGGMAGSVSQALGELAESVRDFSADVRAAMAVREAELREGAGLDGELGAKPSASGS